MAKLLLDRTRLVLVPALALAAACGGDRATAPAAQQQSAARFASVPAEAAKPERLRHLIPEKLPSGRAGMVFEW